MKWPSGQRLSKHVDFYSFEVDKEAAINVGRRGLAPQTTRPPNLFMANELFCPQTDSAADGSLWGFYSIYKRVIIPVFFSPFFFLFILDDLSVPESPQCLAALRDW